MRPVIKQSSAEKIFRYFFGDTWKNYPVIELAIRNGKNKINIFDDELYVWNRKRGVAKTFNWNADPSAYRIGGEAIAILRNGVHFYKISYHHIWNNSRRYVALRPNTPDAALPVWRTNAKGKLELSIGFAINQHAGGDRTTGSRGCQTAPRSQYSELITFIGDALDVKIPLGVQKRAEKRFVEGIGNVPYVLITQAEFDYILRLDESEFDSEADLRYQMQHFTGIPKIERVRPIITEVQFPEAVISELEAAEETDLAATLEDAENLLDFDNPLKNLEDFTKPVTETVGTVKETVTEKIEDGKKQIEKATTEITSTFEPKNIPAFIPRLGKQWLLGLIPGAGFVSTVAAYLAQLPQWMIVFLAAIAAIALWKFFELVIKHREKIGDFLINCYRATSDPEMHNLIPVSAKAFVGSRQAEIERALEK